MEWKDIRAREGVAVLIDLPQTHWAFGGLVIEVPDEWTLETPRLGYTLPQTIAEGFDEVMALGGDVVCLFHSAISATDAALDVVRDRWKGPICVYPEAERMDYVDTYRDRNAATPVSPDDFVAWATGCVEAGVQVVGGCCGIEIEHIRPLRDALSTHLP